jgi:hypothetical protein
LNLIEKLTECIFGKPELGNVTENFVPFQLDCRHKRVQRIDKNDKIMNPIPASYNDYKLPWGANIEKYSTCEFDFFKKIRR